MGWYLGEVLRGVTLLSSRARTQGRSGVNDLPFLLVPSSAHMESNVTIQQEDMAIGIPSQLTKPFHSNLSHLSTYPMLNVSFVNREHDQCRMNVRGSVHCKYPDERKKM